MESLYLPIDLQREIVGFIPRHPTAQIIYDSRNILSLNYVRRFNFETIYPPCYKRMFIWEELKPTNLKSVFYGDTKKIIRSNISKGQFIKLRSLGIIY